MFNTPSFKKSLIVEQFQGNYLKLQRWIVYNKEAELGSVVLWWNFLCYSLFCDRAKLQFIDNKCGL